MIIGNKNFDASKGAYIMGILNVTPDSFYDGGMYNHIDAALKHCEKMIAEGADIIDVGGQSSRPGYKEINAQKETERVCGVVAQIKSHFDVPVSVDTYSHHVAKASLSAGADMINDIWRLKHDNGQMAQVISKAGVPCCLMHNRKNTTYNSLIDDIVSDLQDSVKIAFNQGINKDNIIIDPGIGFAKSYSQNMEVMRSLNKIKNAVKLPMLLGASNKSFIGKALGLCDNNIDGRLEGTLATTALGMIQDVTFFRVHNVAENKRVIDMLKAVKDECEAT